MKNTQEGDAYYEIRKSFFWVFALLATLLLISDIALLRQNRNLKTALGQEPPAWRPPVGAVIGPIEGVGLKGEQVRLAWGEDSRDTFLFVFSPHCGVCDLSWPAWRDLARSADSKSHRLAYLNLTPPLREDCLKKMELSNSLVVSEIDPKSIVAANIRFTPEVIQLSSRGEIEHVWMGLTEGEALVELKQALQK